LTELGLSSHADVPHDKKVVGLLYI